MPPKVDRFGNVVQEPNVDRFGNPVVGQMDSEGNVVSVGLSLIHISEPTRPY